MTAAPKTEKRVEVCWVFMMRFLVCLQFDDCTLGRRCLLCQRVATSRWCAAMDCAARRRIAVD
jgi:hypothetical protein